MYYNIPQPVLLPPGWDHVTVYTFTVTPAGPAIISYSNPLNCHSNANTLVCESKSPRAAGQSGHQSNSTHWGLRSTVVILFPLWFKFYGDPILFQSKFQWTWGRFKNTYELLNLRAFKFLPVNKIHIFQCMGKVFCVEFQRYPLKFHTKYPSHTLKNMIFIQHGNFKSS